MNNILSYAQISVEVLNDHCWQNCEDFDPCLCNLMYATNSGGRSIYSRYFQCKNLDTCKRLSSYLERGVDTE